MKINGLPQNHHIAHLAPGRMQRLSPKISSLKTLKQHKESLLHVLECTFFINKFLIVLYFHEPCLLTEYFPSRTQKARKIIIFH